MVAGARSKPAAPMQGLTAQMLLGAITTFRALITAVEGTADPQQKLERLSASMNEVATVLERVGAAVATGEDRDRLMEQHISQVTQQNTHLLQQATAMNQQIAALQSRVTNAANNPGQHAQTPNTHRRPLCDSKSVAN